MKKIYLILVLAICYSCGVKKAKNALESGNYEETINVAIRNLTGDKDTRRKQDYVFLLHEAYERAVQQDYTNLKRLKASNNPTNLETIYETYVALQNRQDRLIPLLPLQNLKAGKALKFTQSDYTDRIEDAKFKLSDYLLQNARNSLDNPTKQAARAIYDDMRYVSDINPNYQDVNSLMDRAQELGTDNVRLNLINNTQQVIPKRLEDELLNFSSYGLNNQWIVYHSNASDIMDYDYNMDVSFNAILISPDQVLQKELQREQRIKDGFEYVKDSRGNVMKDSLGNDIKRDKFITVKALITQNEQLKDVTVNGVVVLSNTKTGQVIDRFPLKSTFVFNYLHGSVQGDRRAVDANYLRTLNPRAVPFPTTEQMIYDAGEDMKAQLKSILNRIQL